LPLVAGFDPSLGGLFWMSRDMFDDESILIMVRGTRTNMAGENNGDLVTMGFKPHLTFHFLRQCFASGFTSHSTELPD